MSNEMIQLLVLAGIAVFLILRLKNVLGTREGFERPSEPEAPIEKRANRNRDRFEVIEGGVDLDIADHAEEGSSTALALAEMKKAESSFSVGEFLEGARGAYEMILMSFERGEIDEIKPFLSADVAEAFDSVVEQRADQGLAVEANFVGVRKMTLKEAQFDQSNKEAEITVSFIGELTSLVRDAAGDVVEGSANEIKRQKDVWTFSRKMGSNDPNWQLVATGE